MSERQYTILLEPGPDDGSYTVMVPALPGVVTQGATFEEALTMAREAIQCHIEGLLADGEAIPEERERLRIATISVAA